MTGASTVQLTSERLELVSGARAQVFMRAALVVILVAVGTAASLRLFADGQASLDRHSRLQQDHAALQAGFARLEAELALEQAIRSALDQQVTELNRRIADLDSQLAFVHAQGGRPRPAAPPK
jgi:uncharacterized small protein (DUF1192 family)